MCANSVSGRATSQRSGLKPHIVAAWLVLLLWRHLCRAQAPHNSHWRLQSACNYHSLYLNKEIQQHYGIWWHRRSSHVYSWDGRRSSKRGNCNHLWANHVKKMHIKLLLRCLAMHLLCTQQFPTECFLVLGRREVRGIGRTLQLQSR